MIQAFLHNLQAVIIFIVCKQKKYYNWIHLGLLVCTTALLSDAGEVTVGERLKVTSRSIHTSGRGKSRIVLYKSIKV